MTMAARLVKYQTRSENCYVYDPNTNEIIRVGEVIYKILDDFHVLSPAEIAEKYHPLGETPVLEALAQLEELQCRGLVRDEVPRRSSRAEQVLYDGDKVGPIDVFLRDRRASLTLEITQRCNLRCEYCCYGEHYDNYRDFAENTMSLEMAKGAIKEYISHHTKKFSVGFYGGEPLLEYELLKQIVSFAEECAGTYDMEPLFHVTTNGTLLTDEKIHFLVKHNFVIFISLDGDRKSHDRYRVFRDDKYPERGTGSYDTVIKNVERFVELYPHYRNRGIALTLTATADRDAIDDILRRLKPDFPLTRINAVRDPANQRQVPQPLELNASVGPPCEGMSCVNKGHLGMRNDDSGVTISSPVNDEASDKMPSLPDFVDWKPDRMAARRRRLVEALHQDPDADAIQKKFPLDATRLRTELFGFHNREITDGSDKCIFAYNCVPGYNRFFCSSLGVYYPCERLGHSKLFELGNVGNDMDVVSVINLTEKMRLAGDCGNCVARRICYQCPASAIDYENSGTVDALAYQKGCQRIIDYLPVLLKEYTTLIETNQKFTDSFLHMPEREEWKEWLDKIKIVLTNEQFCEIDTGVEEIDSIV